MSLTQNFITEVLPLHMDKPEMLYGGLGVFAVGTAMAVISAKHWRQAGNDELQAQLYPDPDQKQAVSDQFKSHARRSEISWTLASFAALSGAVQLAHPYNETTSYRAHEIGIVIEAGADSRAKDVTDSSNKGTDSRIQASLISALDLVHDLDGKVRVKIVLAGAHPESVGAIKTPKDAKDVFENATKYLKTFENAGDPDIRAGIAVAKATNPERVVVFVEDDSAKTQDTIRDEQGITVISVGQPGTSYTFLGQEETASYTSNFNGVEAKTATTTSAIKDILKKEITDKIVEKGKDPINGYGKGALILAGLALLKAGIREMKFPIKGKKA